VPAKVWIGLAIAVGLDVPVQLFWKALMLKYGDPSRGPVSPTFHHQLKWFIDQARAWALLGLFLLQFFNWIWVLGNADLSFAQPFTALSYLIIPVCAAFYFHEHLTVLRVVGILLVLIGVIVIGTTEHRTTPKAGDA